MTQKKRVLVTGASGFIGTTLCEAMRTRHDLIGLDRVPPRERFPEVQHFICDVLDRATLQRIILEVEPDVIVHLAARARVQDGITDPIGTYRVNAEGTINVLDVAQHCPNLEKVIAVSSETVYGVVETYPTPEELGPGKPTSVYAASKAAGDLLATGVADCFPGVKVIVARSAMGCGPRSNPADQVTSRFVKSVLDGKPLRFPGDPDAVVQDKDGVHGDRAYYPAPGVKHPTRDVSPAWNFAHGVRLMVENPDASGVYNLGSGDEISILDLAHLVTKTLGKGEVTWDPTFQYRKGEDGYRTALDITRARKGLGYEPVVTLEAAIRLTAAWMEKYPDYWQRKRVPAHDAWATAPNVKA